MKYMLLTPLKNYVSSIQILDDNNISNYKIASKYNKVYISDLSRIRTLLKIIKSHECGKIYYNDQYKFKIIAITT